MASVDLTKLEDYIVVQLGETPVDQVKDLRELDQDFGDGVYGLWSDAAQSIVAFAFNKVQWDEDQAQTWVAQSKKGDVAALSFDEVRALVDKALMARFGGADRLPDGTVRATDSLWVSEIGPDKAIYFHNGDHFAIPYTLTGATVTLGDPEPVNRGWRTPDDRPVILHAYDVHLEDTDAGEDDGLIWKEIIKPGSWFKMNTGRQIDVTADIIKEAYRAFTAGLPKFVSVPADSHHGETRGVVPAEANRGFVPKLKLIGDALFGGFKLTDPQIAAGVQDGSIADCSVYLQPDVVHPSTGEKFPWVLRHVLLTNDPLAQNLRPFNDIPADGGGGNVTVIHYRQAPEYRQEVTMPEKPNEPEVLSGADEIVLTGDAAQEYGKLAALGLTADELQALVAQRAAITAQAEALRLKAREMEVIHIVKALEGGDEHAGVAHIAGYRHYPVVISAVEQALKDAPTALALDADDDGVSPFDAALLAVVNAIPAEGRVKVDDAPGTDKRPHVAAAADDLSDAKVDAFLETIG